MIVLCRRPFSYWLSSRDSVQVAAM